MVVVLYGAKAVGKSWVAEELRRRVGVHHVDADRLVLGLMSRGECPDPEYGWLGPVEEEVRRALVVHWRVSVEATGAWDSDWMLADRLAASGCRVVTVWITASLQVAWGRLAERKGGKVPVSAREAVWIHAEATRRAAARSFDAAIDTSGPRPADLGQLWSLLT
jgi:predicted kinase